MAVGMVETFMILNIFLGGGMLSVMGIPPGERHQEFQSMVPSNALVYAEWSAQGSPKENTPGIDAMMLEPEVQQLIQKLESSVVEYIQSQTGDEPLQKMMAEQMPGLIKNMIKTSGCIFVTDNPEFKLGENQFPESAQAGIIFHLGDRSDEIVATIKKVMSTAGMETDLKRFHIPTPPDAYFEVHHEGNYLMLAYGKGTIDRILKMKSSDSSLATNEQFQAAQTKVTCADRTSHVYWVNVNAAQELAGRLGAPLELVSMIKELSGLENLQWIASGFGIEDGAFSTKVHVQCGAGTKGILSMLAGKGISADDLANIPAKAEMTFMESFDAQAIYNELKSIFIGVVPQGEMMWNQAIAGIEQETKLSLEKDILPSIGNSFVAYNDMSKGLPPTGTVMILSIADSDSFKRCEDSLMSSIKENLEVRERYGRMRGAEIREEKFNGSTIRYLSIIGEDDFPFTPAWTYHKDRLILAANIQAIRSHVRFLESGKESMASKLNLPEGQPVLCAFRLEIERFAELLYTSVPMLGQIGTSMMGAEKMKIDASVIPSADAIIPHLRPIEGMITRTEDGIHFELKSTIPLGTLFGSLGPFMAFSTTRSTEFDQVQAGLQIAPQAVPAQRAIPREKKDERKAPQLPF